MATKKPSETDGPGVESGETLRGYEDASHENQSFPVDESEMAGMTLFEKKCHLINKEIDAMGMGKYQWCLWCLCGFGYLLDLLWAQAFGLILTPIQQELGVAGNVWIVPNRQFVNVSSKSRRQHFDIIFSRSNCRCSLLGYPG